MVKRALAIALVLLLPCCLCPRGSSKSKFERKSTYTVPKTMPREKVREDYNRRIDDVVAAIGELDSSINELVNALYDMREERDAAKIAIVTTQAVSEEASQLAIGITASTIRNNLISRMSVPALAVPTPVSLIETAVSVVLAIQSVQSQVALAVLSNKQRKAIEEYLDFVNEYMLPQLGLIVSDLIQLKKDREEWDEQMDEIRKSQEEIIHELKEEEIS